MVKREPRAGCILINPEGRLLIVHNVCSDYWGFPKGGKREHETYVQAALRELREETGKIIDGTTIIDSISSNKSKLFIAAGQFDPICRVDMREIDQYAWVELNELKKLKTSKFTQSFFNKLELFMNKKI